MIFIYNNQILTLNHYQKMKEMKDVYFREPSLAYMP